MKTRRILAFSSLAGIVAIFAVFLMISSGASASVSPFAPPASTPRVLNYAGGVGAPQPEVASTVTISQVNLATSNPALTYYNQSAKVPYWDQAPEQVLSPLYSNAINFTGGVSSLVTPALTQSKLPGPGLSCTGRSLVRCNVWQNSSLWTSTENSASTVTISNGTSLWGQQQITIAMNGSGPGQPAISSGQLDINTSLLGNVAYGYVNVLYSVAQTSGTACTIAANPIEQPRGIHPAAHTAACAFGAVITNATAGIGNAKYYNPAVNATNATIAPYTTHTIEAPTLSSAVIQSIDTIGAGQSAYISIPIGLAKGATVNGTLPENGGKGYSASMNITFMGSLGDANQNATITVEGLSYTTSQYNPFGVTSHWGTINASASPNKSWKGTQIWYNATSPLPVLRTDADSAYTGYWNNYSMLNAFYQTPNSYINGSAVTVQWMKEAKNLEGQDYSVVPLARTNPTVNGGVITYNFNMSVPRSAALTYVSSGNPTGTWYDTIQANSSYSALYNWAPYAGANETASYNTKQAGRLMELYPSAVTCIISSQCAPAEPRTPLTNAYNLYNDTTSVVFSYTTQFCSLAPNVCNSPVQPLSGVSISPSSATISPNGSMTFNAVPVCGTGSCAGNITYHWTVSNSLCVAGHATSNSPVVVVTCGQTTGASVLSVNASQDGYYASASSALTVGSSSAPVVWYASEWYGLPVYLWLLIVVLITLVIIAYAAKK